MPDNADYLDGFLSSAFASEGTDSDLMLGGDDRWSHGQDEPALTQIGPYCVVERIGSGGVGTVYRAEDDALGRQVAIKVLRIKFAGDAKTVERFVSEARLCAQLTHPGVVAVHEVGELEDGRPYFVMRLIEGQTFAARIRSARESLGSPGALTQIFSEFESLCRTLASVHEQNVVHGDLKPHNVMVGSFGEVQLMDWGFARRLDAQEASRRGGTPAYMAPEQASGAKDPVTLRTDVFGLGAILCQVLTGSPPYSGREEAEVLIDAKRGWRRPELEQRLRASDRSDELVGLVHECLSAEPSDRPADASVVADRLHTIAVAREHSRRALEIDAAEARARAAQERRARRLTVALACSLLLGGLVAGLAWLRAERETDAHRALAVGVVDRALRDVSIARIRAADANTAPMRAWVEVQDAALRLRTASGNKALDPTARVNASAAAVAAEDESEAAIHRIDLLSQLAELRPHFGEDRDATELDASYAEAFAAVGVDLGQPLEQVVAGVLASPIRRALVESLDRWVHFRRKRRVPTADSWRDVHEVVTLADDDPWRSRLRAAFVAGDRAALLAMASETRAGEVRGQSAASVDILAESLVHVGQRRAAIELYRSALRRFPDDYVLTHHLAVLLEFERDPPRDEILRLAWAGVVLRPRDPHALIDLGREIAITGDTAAAIDFLGRANSITPSTRALLLRGNLLQRLGQLEEAVIDFAELAALGHRMGPVLHGLALTRLARLDPAIDTLHEAVELSPDDARTLLQLGRVLCKRGRVGDVEAGLAVLDRAIELDPRMAEVHCNRALALRWLGRFAESLEAMRRGHNLGATQDVWQYPTDAWVRYSKALANAAQDYDAWRRVAGDGERADQVDGALSLVPPEILAMIALRRREDAVAWSLARQARTRALDPMTGIVVPERPFWFEFALAGARSVVAANADSELDRAAVEQILDALNRWTALEFDHADRVGHEDAPSDSEPMERGTPELLRFRYRPAMAAFGAKLAADPSLVLENGKPAAGAWRDRVAEVEDLLEGN